jgi:hypothetical protein
MADAPVRTYATIAADLDEPLRRSILQCAIGHRDQLGPERRRDLELLLSMLEVNGFRSWQDAPPARLAAGAASAFRNDAAFWSTVFRAWLDLKPALRDGALAVVQELGFGRVCDCCPNLPPVGWEGGTLSDVAGRLRNLTSGTIDEARLALELTGTGRPSGTVEGEVGEHPDQHVGSVKPTQETAVKESGQGDAAPAGAEGSSTAGSSLQVKIQELAAALERAAPDVRACAETLALGGPPARAIIELLATLETRWDGLSSEVAALLGSARDELPDRATELSKAVAGHMARQDEVRAASEVLRSVAALETERPVAELSLVQARARAALEGENQTLDREWLGAVRALVELAGDDVADDRAEELYGCVEHTLGHALARAAFRRFIRRAPAAPHEPTSEDSRSPRSKQEPVPAPGPSGAAAPQQAASPVVVAMSVEQPTTQRSAPISPAGREPEPQESVAHAEPTPAPAQSADTAVSAVTSARIALENRAADRAGDATAAVWALAGDGEYAVAHALARALEADHLGSVEPLSPILRGLVFSGRVCAEDDAAAIEVLSALTSADFVSADPKRATAKAVLGASITLRPALLSRASGALGILQALELDATGNLQRIREVIARAPSLGVEIGFALLGGVQQAGRVRAELEALSRDCGAWVSAARLQKLVYAPATDTWHRLLAPGNSFFTVLEPVIANDTSRREAVATGLTVLSEERQLARLLRGVEKEVRGRKADSDPINARAYQSLIKHVHDGLAYPRRWLELARLTHENRRNPAMQKFDTWRAELLREVETGREWLRSSPRGGETDIMAARRVLLRALDNLAGLFSAEAISAQTASSEQLVYGPLLRIPTLTLDERWEPRQTSAELTTRLLHAVAAGVPSWDDALEQHLREGRFLSVHRIFELADLGLASVADLPRRRGDVAIALEREKLALQTLLEVRTAEVEQAVALDILDEPKRLELVSTIARYSPDAVREFDVARAAMDALGSEIAALQGGLANDIRTRVDAAGIEQSDPETFRRIREALERRDFPIATEHLDAHARGEPLQTSSHVDVFADVFFPRFVKECMAADVHSNDVVDAVATGRKVGPIDASAVPGAQREEAATFLRAWQRAKQRIDVVKSALAVLEGIGFRRARLLSERGPRPTENAVTVDLEVEELRDRRTCVIPQFGSLARGRYRLALVWGRPSEEELLSLVGAQHGAPTLVLYFGRMTEPRRRELARLARESRRQLLVLDELLLLFLAMQRGARLPVLFRCALPFTIAEPYVTSAGLVPREMFFGRERERQAIFDPLGTNLVYGGRQLGKTALLREVERTYHDADRGVIVIWTDLKQAGIGRERPAKAVWELAGGLLEQHGVVKKGTVGFPKIRERVLEWLETDAARRIVLLLDEADLFVTADRQGEGGQGFSTLLQLKQLLDESHKRFKFVLAGLHDVQRTSRDPNTPLAHLGSPLCIGPLMGDGEAVEARALIEVPLGTLGYRFAHPDLPTRILSHTNYYPSLIQLFCWHLLDHVSNTRKVTFDPRTSPPYVITAQHVDEAYRSQRLRAAIRDRFKWTLDLDPRYKLIALLIALESRERPEALAVGFSAREIQQMALAWWEIGFDDRSPEAFRTILDEMIGLGLLRKASEGAYALRSTNIVNLLGGRKEIEEELEATIALEPPKPHEHPQLRRAERADNPLRRSPLTLTQEGRILQRDNGACVVFGARIADRDVLPEFLRTAISQATVTALDAPSWPKLEYAISKQLDRKDPYAVLVVSADTPWTEAWVEDAQKLLRKRRSKEGTVRVVFLGDPAAALRWCGLDPVVQQRLVTHQGIEVLTLAPWSDAALRAWFEDCQFGPAANPAGRQRVREVTGGWGALVHRFGERCKDKQRRWEEQLAALTESLSSDEISTLFDIPATLLGPMKILAELQGDDPLEDAFALVEDGSVTLEALRTALGWASFLGLATGASTGWRVDPLLARTVRGAP